MEVISRDFLVKIINLTTASIEKPTEKAKYRKSDLCYCGYLAICETPDLAAKRRPIDTL
jgi:hypothetical protein